MLGQVLSSPATVNQVLQDGQREQGQKGEVNFQMVALLDNTAISVGVTTDGVDGRIIVERNALNAAQQINAVGTSRCQIPIPAVRVWAVQFRRKSVLEINISRPFKLRVLLACNSTNGCTSN